MKEGFRVMEGQEKLDLFGDEQKFIKGRHFATIYRNDDNLFSVIKIAVDETNLSYDDKYVVVTGFFPILHEQETYTFYGQMVEHPKYGLQFQVKQFRKEVPKTREAVISYLSGDLFEGIGKKTAIKIVEILGDNAISKILDDPSVLESIPNLPSKKANKIYETLMENQGLDQIMIALNKYGFGPQLSMKIYQVYKEETLQIIEENPYKLVEDVEGIGFNRADDLGKKLGIPSNHPNRIRSGCLYTLDKECMQGGHVFVYTKDLLEKVKKLLEGNQRDEIEYTQISHEVIKLGEEGKIIVENDRTFLPSLYFAEKGLVSNIKRILQQTQYAEQFPESEFLLALGKLEERLEIQYAPTQKEAIQTALMSPMLILTGGPGTGKTTVIKGIVELYSELHGCSLNKKDYKDDEPYPFLLAAPTGRAAKRMAESTGLQAVTIHRLLGWNGVDGFAHDEDNPLTGKIIIIDESSMLDIWLANQLFKALPDEIQVILVGDEDQLPSVGPGQVLRDLLDSERIPTVRLTDIYRQEEGSSIIELAHQIKKGNLPKRLERKHEDRSFIPCSTSQVNEVVKKVVLNALKKGFSKKDIQVLAPMYKGPAGIDQLNRTLQDIFNNNDDGSKKEIAFGDVVYRIGDKVLQLVNQPEDNIFNGDIGEIISILYAKENEEKEDMVVVSFDGVEAVYSKQDLIKITHAFCCSVHKSQGSEFPIVIFPVVKSYYRMLRKNLIYTAITRSKKFLILCGEEEAFRLGVSRTDEEKRQTTLKEKLVEMINNSTEENVEEKQDLTYEEKLMEVDPLIGMEGITPYDFMK